MGAPKILLFENRHEQSVLFQLNFNIYLGSKITIVKNKEKFESIINEDPNKYQLIIATSSTKNQEAIASLEHLNDPPPILLLTDLPKPEIKFPQLDKNTAIKSLLKESAKILCITPQAMAKLEVPKNYPIPINLFEYLIYFPSQIYQVDKDGERTKEYEHGEAIDKNEIAMLIKSGAKFLYIDSDHRLKFANAYSEQISGLSKRLELKELTMQERMLLVDSTSNMISKIYNDSGIEVEITSLAQSCAKSMLAISESAGSLKELQDHLLQNQHSYRYIHSQLIIYIGLQSLKMLGWWDEEKGNNFALAAFYHDIILLTDEEAKINNQDDLDLIDLSSENKERILHHGKVAYELLNAAQDINTDVKMIVREHHGSQFGIGFSENISAIGDTSKLFVIVENWTALLLKNLERKCEFDIDENKNLLKMKYIDPLAFQIIETLCYLDQQELDTIFNNFMYAGGEPNLKQDELNNKTVVSDNSPADLSSQEVFSFLKDIPDIDPLVLQQFKTIEFFDEKIASQNLDTDNFTNDDKVTIKNVTDFIKDIKESIQLSKEKTEGSKKVFKNMTKKINDIMRVTSKSPSIKKLLEKTDKIPKDGVLEIMKICKFGNKDLIEQYKVSDHDFKKTDKAGRNCFHYAAIGDNIEAMEYLIAKGVNINVLDGQRKSPLFYTVINENINSFNYLLTHKARLQQQAIGGINIGMLAARIGNMEMIRTLHHKGLDFHATDYKNKSILDYAKAGKNQELIMFLEKKLKE